MSWRGAPTEHGEMNEHLFDITVDGRKVPGVYWSPKSGANERLVLLGHGGTTHKKTEYIQEVAVLLANYGIASMAIDGPGHGERAQGAVVPGVNEFADVWSAGGGHDGMLVDWRGALDFIEAEQGVRPTGWWGLSMGTMMGLPVTATDSRISVALLGLMGNWGPNADELSRLAPDVQCPVRFLVQWDDEIIPREACLNLFSLLGTKRKTLHGNPGRHAQVPRFEIKDSVGYLDRHLGK